MPVAPFSPPSTSPRHQHGGVFGFLFVVMLIIAMVAFAVYAFSLNQVITTKFENRRWDIPARVYSRPLPLQAGEPISKDELDTWLKLLNYSKNDSEQSGTYHNKGNTYTIATRGFDYGDKDIDTPQVIEVRFGNGRIASVNGGEAMVRLEPISIGSIYPDSNEDRQLITLENTPQSLIDALIATEDRNFYEHHGISLRGTARAFLNNFQGGGLQGGSTLTQQLVKNFYLGSERSLKRKANEAIMAVLLEMQYSKKAILQAYLNEINLGQNGNQSINGFGIAAQFYFNKPLSELRVDQHALLVGIAKGSSHYNPRKHPERAKERRNTVLHNMLVTGKLSQEDYDTAISQELDVVKTPSIAKPKFPDFLDYIRRELNTRYKADDLKSAGLRIITTLDPIAQTAADNAFATQMKRLHNASKRTKELQGALVSANPKTGEVLALVGSSSEFTGFNRAIDAKRQVGSLLKPIIYLMALQSGEFNLASGVLDEEQTYDNWTPKNYDGASHGTVPLTTALANSYNQAAVNTGMVFGTKQFVGYLKQLGIDDDIAAYPSTMLGAVNLSPMQMLSVYQIFAAGGTYAPLHSIKSVIDEKGRVLQHTLIRHEERIPKDAAYLTNYAMQKVISEGTAKAATRLGNNIAGKTGTTNDAKDAWFAGYSGNYVSVVWVGRDDNQPIGLTGGSGALPIWIDYMQRLKLQPVKFDTPKGIEWAWVENGTGRASDETCQTAVHIPVKPDSVSLEPDECQLLADALLQEEPPQDTETALTDTALPTDTPAPDINPNP